MPASSPRDIASEGVAVVPAEVTRLVGPSLLPPYPEPVVAKWRGWVGAVIAFGGAALVWAAIWYMLRRG